MDGIASLFQITVIAATNRPDAIDPALLRPGRFDRLVYVGLPDCATRLKIFVLQSKKYPFNPTISLETLAEATRNYSGAEIVHICQDAAYQAMALNCDIISEKLLLSTIATTQPRISAAELDYFETFSNARSN
jgi:AAA family ATPase